MVYGWRRAFCTSIPKDREPKVQTNNHTNHSPKPISKFGFFSNPSTPRLQSQPVSSPSLRCRTTVATTPTPSTPNSPKLQCKAPTPKKSSSPRLFQLSNPSSPKSPSSFSLLKAGLGLSKSRCGICLQSVKSGQGTAIFTGECSHSFHFPCVASHVKKHQMLVCPVCSTGWKELPLLPSHNNPKPESESEKLVIRSSVGDLKTTKSLRVYDDDESLMSPSSYARFNPIPESNENDDEYEQNGTEEFQGIFVNASLLSREISLKDVEVNLLPEAAVVAVGRSYETYAVVLKVKAPTSVAAGNGKTASLRRAPIDLVTVVDVSARMNGVKMQMMKKAMRFVISSLCETDRLSIVAFSASSKRLLPLRRMTTAGRRSARRIVDALCCIGVEARMTDALKKAAKVIEDRRERNPVASMMLLSDGHDERVHTRSANQKRSSSVVSATRFSHFEIPVHAIGFRESGDYNHAPPEDEIAKCVGGLLCVVVQDLRLQLGFVTGSASSEIAAVYSLTGRSMVLGPGSSRLGDLYAEEERELLVELKVPSSSIGSHHVLSVQCSYRDPLLPEHVHSKEQALLIPRPQVVRSSVPSTVRLRNLHVTTRAVAESRRLIEQKDLTGALLLLSSARALLMQSCSADEYLRSLEAELAELHRRRHVQLQSRRQNCSGRDGSFGDEKQVPLTPTSAWRAAERLAKVAIMRKSMNRVSDLHGFENARF